MDRKILEYAPAVIFTHGLPSSFSTGEVQFHHLSSVHHSRMDDGTQVEDVHLLPVWMAGIIIIIIIIINE